MRIIAVHGIGRHADDFRLAWQGKLREQLQDDSAEVVGLRWSDEQDQVADRFPVASERLQGVMSRIGIGAVENFRSSAAYDLLHSHIYDLFAYSFLHELRHYMQTVFLRDLLKLVRGREQDTVIVAHSLGTAMTVHVAALTRRLADTVPVRGAVLLAPPLGVRSPLESVPDPLAVSPDSSLPTAIHDLDGLTAEEQIRWAATRDYGDALDESARLQLLIDICNDWPSRRLHFVVNTNDVVCSDVKFELGDTQRDIISIKQGYSDDEREVIDTLQRFHEVSFGRPDLGEVAANHDAIAYLGTAAVGAALQEILS